MKEKYWLADMAGQIGSHHILRLLEKYQTAEAVYGLTKEELLREAFLTEKMAEQMLAARNEEKLQAAVDDMDKKEIRLITIGEPEYPKRLAALPDRPYALFVRGSLPPEQAVTVGIVGARQCSEYGREAAGRLGEVLAGEGISIVSGMARGTDSAGHFGALRAGADTYAVLGCGVDVCYPPGNRLLYERMIEHGGILSEYPLGTEPLAWHFPVRNRIISGLCDVLVVVEAKEKSGSLITADAALEQGKEIYAVPGRMGDVQSRGCNRLIRQGAGIILSPEDFLKDLGIIKSKNRFPQKFSKNSLEKEEALLYSVLDLQEKNINEIIEATGFETTECIRLLSALEDKGYIRETFQNYYIRTLK